MGTHRTSLKSRRFLAASEPLVGRLRTIAKAKNKTLCGLTNEILEQAIRADDLDESLRDIINYYQIIKMAKQNESVLVPERVWHLMLDEAFEKNPALFKETFYDSGLWYGKYFSAILTDLDSLEGIKTAFQTIFWNVSTLEIAQIGDKTILTCTDPSFTAPRTEALSTVFEGVMHSLGYCTDEKNVSRGLVMLAFTKNVTGKEDDASKKR